MKKAVGLVLATLAMCACAAIGSAQSKVGYVDINRITSKAKPVTSLMIDTEDQIKGMQRDIDTKRKRAAELQGELRRTEGVVSADEQEKKRKELDKLKNELDEIEVKARRRMQEWDSTVFEPMLKKILFAIEDVAKEKQLDVVLRGEAVLYGASGADITDDVIKRLNRDGGLDAKAGDKDKGTASKESKSSEEKKEAAEEPASTRSDEPASTETTAASEPSEPETKKTQVFDTKSEASPKTVRPVDRQPE